MRKNAGGFLPNPTKQVLQRREDEKDPKQRSVITAFGRRHRDELAERPKRNQSEQHDHPDALQQKAEHEDDDHQPPDTHLLVVATDDRALDAHRLASAEQETDQRRDAEGGEHNSEQDHGARGQPPRAGEKVDTGGQINHGRST